MSYECKILLDSISPTGKRITTFEITFPRIVLAEFNTHRMFSRNSASSRAIPFKKQVANVIGDPFIPEKFPINTKGMQPQDYINQFEQEPGFVSQYQTCKDAWLAARDESIKVASFLYYNNDIHKQIVNRLLEPFMWHTVIITATEFDNFFRLRCDENAQYEIRRIADLMYEAYHAYDEPINITKCAEIGPDFLAGEKWSTIKPQELKINEWHCPLVSEEDDILIEQYIISETKYQDYKARVIELKKQISVARCARVSYLTHDGKRDIEKDLELFERLVIRKEGYTNPRHMSPTEHVATPYYVLPENEYQFAMLEDYRDGFRTSNDGRGFDIISGNFIGWKQMRKEFQDENCTNFRKEN